MNWQLFTAVSVLALSISIVLQRVLIHKDKVHPAAYAVVFQAMVGVVLFAFVAFHGFSLAGIENVLFPAITSVILYGAGHIVYAKTLQHVEASAFSVLFATQAIWIMLLGVALFSEHLSLLQIFGSVLIFASIVLLALDLEGTVVPANLNRSQYLFGGGAAEPHLFASDNRQFVQHFQGDLEDLQTALSKQARLQA